LFFSVFSVILRASVVRCRSWGGTEGTEDTEEHREKQNRENP